MTTPDIPDPFPRDIHEKLVYRVREGRVMHFNDEAHYEAGEVIKISPKRVKRMGLNHLIESVKPVEEQEGKGRTRAVKRKPTRKLKTSKKVEEPEDTEITEEE